MEGAIESTWGDSAQESFKSAKKHFNVFLGKYYSKSAPPAAVRKLFGLDAAVNPADQPDDFFTWERIVSCNNQALIDASLLNKFAYYLAKLAVGFTIKKEPLSYNSAMRYLSSMKQNRVRQEFNGSGNGEPIPKEKMSLIYAGMLKLFVQRHRDSKTPMVKAHYTASRREIVVLSMLCLWSDEPRFAMFGMFLMSLLQCAARATECSVLRYDSIGMESPPEFLDSEYIAHQSVFRDKTYESQQVPIFNDRDSFCTDWYFMTFLSMLSNQPSNEIFRSMNAQHRAQRAKVADAEAEMTSSLGAAADLDVAYGEDDSGQVEPNPNDSDDEEEVPVAHASSTRKSKASGTSASEQFGKLVKLLTDVSNKLLQGLNEGGEPESETLQLARQYLEDMVGGDLSINNRLSSHSGKRHSVNRAHNNPNVKTAWVAQCSGWVLKGLNTLFDYVDLWGSSARHVARARNGWTEPLTGQEGLAGGHPPMLSALSKVNFACGDMTAELKAVTVCQRLFFDYNDIEGANDVRFQSLLFATFLKDLPEFLKLLKRHPQGKFGGPNASDDEVFLQHSVLKAVFVAMCEEAIPRDEVVPTLLRWSKAIHTDFLYRNFIYLPGSTVRSVLQGALGNGEEDEETTEVQEMMAYFSADFRPLIGYYNFASRRLVSMQASLTELYHRERARDDQIQEILHNQRVMMGQMNQLLTTREPTRGIGVAAVTPSPPRRSGQDRAEEATPISAIPKTVKELTVIDCFVYWHTKRWYEVISTSETKQSYNTIRTAVAYLSLFLPVQVPNCPYNLKPRDIGTEAWAKDVRELAVAAFRQFADWRVLNVVGSAKLTPPTSLKRFADEIKEIPHQKWPEGPSLPTPFPPPIIVDGKDERKRLVDNQDAREKKRQRKAAAAVTLPTAPTPATGE